MSPEKYKELYEKVNKALNGERFVLIVPVFESERHTGNMLMSNINQLGVSKILNSIGSKFHPNTKTFNIFNDNQE